MQEVHSVWNLLAFFEWPAPSLSVVCLVWLTSIRDCALFGFLLNVESRNIFCGSPAWLFGLIFNLRFSKQKHITLEMATANANRPITLVYIRSVDHR